MENLKNYPLNLSLTKQQLDFFLSQLEESSPLHQYGAGTYLFYQGQVPIVAYLLLEGEVALKQNNKTKSLIKSPSLIGLHHMAIGENSGLSAEISKDSKIYYLDKSRYYELAQEAVSRELHEIMGLKVI